MRSPLLYLPATLAEALRKLRKAGSRELGPESLGGDSSNLMIGWIGATAPHVVLICLGVEIIELKPLVRTGVVGCAFPKRFE